MNKIKIYQCNCEDCQVFNHHDRLWILQNPEPGIQNRTYPTQTEALQQANNYLKVTAA